MNDVDEEHRTLWGHAFGWAIGLEYCERVAVMMGFEWCNLAQDALPRARREARAALHAAVAATWPARQPDGSA